MRAKLGLIFVPVLGLAVAGCENTANVAAFRKAAAGLPAAIKAAQDAGLTTSSQGFTRTVPDSENGATAFETAFKISDTSLSSMDGTLLFSWPDPVRAKRFLTPQLTLLRQIKAAAAFRYYQWLPGDEQDPYAKLQNCCRLLCLDSRYRILSGDYAGAMDDLAVTARIFAHYLEDPSLSARLAARSTFLLLVRTMERLLTDTGGRLDMAKKMLILVEATPDDLNPIGTERFIVANTYEQIERAMLTESEENQRQRLLIDAAQSVPLETATSAYQARYLEMATEVAKITSDGTLDLREKSKRLGSLRQTERRGDNTYVFNRAMGDSITASGLLYASAYYNALRDCAILGLKLLIEHGGSAPDKVVATLPIDPFSGKPLVYRKTDIGFEFYSIGPDAKDNGGFGPILNDDIPFRYPMPNSQYVEKSFPR